MFFFVLQVLTVDNGFNCYNLSFSKTTSDPVKVLGIRLIRIRHPYHLTSLLTKFLLFSEVHLPLLCSKAVKT